ncbi:MAG: CAP domain-containing protein [Spirochaetes bacterium]|nr:CAP domain-containing protein [Spirochaetota bacterium]
MKNYKMRTAAFALILFALCIPKTAFAQPSSSAADGWNVALLDTARNVDFLTEEEKNVILEQNKARYNPRKYAELYIVPRLAWFIDENRFIRPGESILITNPFGRAGVAATINAMANLPSLPPLAPSRGMSLAAREHTLDIGSRGILAHTGSDGSSPQQRLSRHVRVDGTSGENLDFGNNRAREIIVSLLISPGHRGNIMYATYRFAGVSIGRHSSYNYMCTIKYSSDFTDRNANYLDTLNLSAGTPGAATLSASGLTQAQFNQIRDSAAGGFVGWTVEGGALVMAWTGRNLTNFNALADTLIPILGAGNRGMDGGFHEAFNNNYDVTFFPAFFSAAYGIHVNAGTMLIRLRLR